MLHSLHSIKLQDELKIDDDEFEDLQSLYKLFDLDRDGILNFKEYEKLLRCLGYRLNGKKTTFNPKNFESFPIANVDMKL